MNIENLIKGKKVRIMTDAKVQVELEVKTVEEKRHSRDLEPATRENDWWPASEDWTTYEVEFTNGFRKSYRNLSDIDLVE